MPGYPVKFGFSVFPLSFHEAIPDLEHREDSVVAESCCDIHERMSEEC